MTAAASALGRPNKTALTVVLLLHGTAIAALVLAKGPQVIRDAFATTDTYNVPVPPPPPPKDIPKPKTDIPPPPESLTRPPPHFDMKPPPTFSFDDRPPPPPHYADATSSTETLAKPVDVQIVPEPAKVEPARARANLASYVSDADYPSAAIRNEEQGTTRFRLTVGADGRVTDCAVTGSSGSSALDQTTCKLMRARAKFTPARGSDGKPTTDIVSNAIRWVLPEG